jgi:hypothetical protein
MNGHEFMERKKMFLFYTITEKFLSRHMAEDMSQVESKISRDIYLSPSSDNNFYRESMIDKILKEGDTEAFENLMKPYKTSVEIFFSYYGKS